MPSSSAISDRDTDRTEAFSHRATGIKRKRQFENNPLFGAAPSRPHRNQPTRTRDQLDQTVSMMQSSPFDMDLCFTPEPYNEGTSETQQGSIAADREQRELQFISQLQVGPALADPNEKTQPTAVHDAVLPARHIAHEVSGCSSKSKESTEKKAAETNVKVQKAPGAPKRFKTAFIFYSTWKHREIRKQLERNGITEKVSGIVVFRKEEAMAHCAKRQVVSLTALA